jgi:hypothetical protein
MRKKIRNKKKFNNYFKKKRNTFPEGCPEQAP